MHTFLLITILLLGFIITFQIARATEFVSIVQGEERTRKQSNRINAFLLLVFLIVGLFGVYWAHHTLADKTLGFDSSASDHGIKVDRMLKYTLIATGIVFVLTQVLLFWYSFKYQERENQKAYYFPHNNKLEMIWTVVPAIVLTVLISFGLVYWFQITGAAPENAATVEITGSQFKWEFRYPGKDGVLGKKNYKFIDESNDNSLGLIWDDAATHDDIVSGGPLHLVVNKPVRLVIGAKDVIHSVGLPHFRLKMDAVPGTPTTLWFTPIKTTKEMIKETGQENFVFEIACDQMCGAGHTGMRGEIIVETQEEYDQWMASQKAQYQTAVVEKEAPAAPAAAPKDSSAAKPADSTAAAAKPDSATTK
ncbi:cytochrome c oxidase subunit II [Niabella yanshanensis]|uniref:Cytochrome c oxidase subunit 2 n=1 Tax=Niabella yanshanensis TaxID=577386 RepID=A0ABZ0W380_9BACT|nr:cytochrome c oxidase subunit II [Niabella yanshanensis]WQD36551.1 cytochrome c oxidase subunit II [Niabella yanshanensis]